MFRALLRLILYLNKNIARHVEDVPPSHENVARYLEEVPPKAPLRPPPRRACSHARVEGVYRGHCGIIRRKPHEEHCSRWRKYSSNLDTSVGSWWRLVREAQSCHCGIIRTRPHDAQSSRWRKDSSDLDISVGSCWRLEDAQEAQSSHGPSYEICVDVQEMCACDRQV